MGPLVALALHACALAPSNVAGVRLPELGQLTAAVRAGDDVEIERNRK
jgi:hypothetical protein